VDTPSGEETESPTVLKRSVGMDLERLRLAAGLERRDAAKALGCATSKIGHLETWRNQPSRSDLRELLELYKASEWLSVLWERTQRGRERGFWESHDGVVGAEGFGTYVGLEFGASALLSWDALAIHGLLQTADYAKAMLTSYGRISEADLAQRLDLRLQRQQVLDRQRPPTLHVILDEGLLRRQVGGPAVLTAQLQHLIDLSTRSTITLQVLPAAACAHGGQHRPFTLLRFPYSHDPGGVYIETRRRSLWREDPEEITEYGAVFSHLADLATSPAQTPDDPQC